MIEVSWAEVPAAGLSAEVRSALSGDVDPVTLTRLARYHRQVDRDRGLAGHALLRRVLAAAVGGRPSAVELATWCAACGSAAHGKPRLAGAAGGPDFNLSHSGERVVVALAPPGVAVGVDVEARRAVGWAALRRSVFSDDEWAATERAAVPDRARTDAWSRKEAAVKASGHGLALPLRRVALSGDGPVWRAELPDGAGTALGRDVDVDPERDEHAAAVAVHLAPGAGEDHARGSISQAPVVRRVELG